MPPLNAGLFACFLRRLSASLIVARLSYRSIIFPLSFQRAYRRYRASNGFETTRMLAAPTETGDALILPKHLDFTKLLIPDAVG